MLRKLTALLVLMALFVVPAAANEYVEGAYALFVEQMAWTTDEQGGTPDSLYPAQHGQRASKPMFWMW